jgi:hypothetical protein
MHVRVAHVSNPRENMPKFHALPREGGRLSHAFMCPPEGGACSSWIKHGFRHSLRQRLRGVTGKWFGLVGLGKGAWAKGGGRLLGPCPGCVGNWPSPTYHPEG